jgi:hypothetical protein
VLSNLRSSATAVALEMQNLRQRLIEAAHDIKDSQASLHTTIIKPS